MPQEDSATEVPTPTEVTEATNSPMPAEAPKEDSSATQVTTDTSDETSGKEAVEEEAVKDTQGETATEQTVPSPVMDQNPAEIEEISIETVDATPEETTTTKPTTVI